MNDEVTKIKAITHYAMEYGAYMGLFFIVKFLISTLAFKYTAANILTTVMAIGIPILAYYLIRNFRDKSKNDTFARLWIFGIYMFFFASLLSAVVEYVYYTYLNPDYILAQQQMVASMLGQIAEQNGMPIFYTMQKMFEENTLPSPINMVFQGIWGVVFLGSLFSLLLAIFMRKRTNNRNG